jgi:hypothetical protein
VLCGKAGSLTHSRRLEVKTTFDTHAAAKELRRWMVCLGIPTLGAAAFLAAALAGAGAWLMAPAIVVGPGIGGIALVWLALSTDTNGAVPAATVVRHTDALAAEAA